MSEDVPCEWEGCDRSFGTANGMKCHHALIHGVSIAGVEVECSWCGAPKGVSQHEAGRCENHFCDQECHGKWQSENRTGEDNPQHKPRVEVECSWCGVPKEVNQHEADRCENHFCDKECEGKWMSENQTGEDNPLYKPKVQVECSWCGVPKEMKQSEVDRHENYFCGRECHGKWLSENQTGEDSPRWKGGKVQVECSWCGAPKEVYPYEMDQYGNHFCDRECQGKWVSENQIGEDSPSWKGGCESYYGPTWMRQRRRAKARDGRACVVCGMTDSEHRSVHDHGLHVHHIRPFRTFEDSRRANQLDNLTTLCRDHHAEYEGDRQGLLLSRSESASAQTTLGLYGATP